MLVVIGVPLDADGKPDLRLPAGVEIARTGPGIFTASWGEHALTAFHVGLVGGTRYFLAAATPRIAAGLAHLGASVVRARDLTAAQRDAIRARGIQVIRRVGDGAIVGLAPKVVLAGQHSIRVALGDALDPGEQYQEVA
jgi:hypothetical protein